MPKAKIDRKTLLRNALSVFKVKGYAGTTMSDLAAANGLLKGSMYHYVDSKESLMLEILVALKEHYVNRVFSKAYDEDLTPVNRIEELASRSEEIFMHEDGGDFFVNIGLETNKSHPQFGAVIKEFFSEWLQSMKHLYAMIMDEEQAQEKAETTVAEIEGSVILMILLNDPNYLHRTNQTLVSEFKHAYVQKISSKHL